MSCNANAMQRCVHVRGVPKGVVCTEFHVAFHIPHTVERVFEGFNSMVLWHCVEKIHTREGKWVQYGIFLYLWFPLLPGSKSMREGWLSYKRHQPVDELESPRPQLIYELLWVPLERWMLTLSPSRVTCTNWTRTLALSTEDYLSW